MKPIAVTALFIAAAALIGAGAFHLGRSSGAGAVPAAAPAAPAERKVLYWHDPMVPGQRFDKPGKSPFMDMQLVPVYADTDAGGGGVSISPTMQQNLGIRLATVRRAALASSFEAVGSVQFDERLVVAVPTRVAGFVERLAVRAPMERVTKGQALATLFAPDWLAPLNELAALQRAGAAAELVAAAHERTRALSIPPELVRRADAGEPVDARFVIVAPAGGVVAELGVREGAAVAAGTMLFRIAGLERVWVVAEIPEAQATRLRRGQAVRAALQVDSSQAFDGRLAELLPEIDPATRTLKARFEVDNRNRRLVPGQLLRLQVAGAKAMRLVVPDEAVIRTGERAVVLVRSGDGAFESRDVVLGPELGDEVEVLQGLNEGEQVVASGQFLIDSEARLRSVTANMSANMGAPASAAAR